MNVGLELVGVFVVPAVLLLFGWLFTRGHYPKHPNGVYGYRTTRSMKNDETWTFAQERWGRSCWRVGWWLLLFSLLVVSILQTQPVRQHGIYIGAWITVQSVLTLGTILPVERALKNTFDEFGRRKAF